MKGGLLGLILILQFRACVFQVSLFCVVLGPPPGGLVDFFIKQQNFNAARSLIFLICYATFSNLQKLVHRTKIFSSK